MFTDKIKTRIEDSANKKIEHFQSVHGNSQAYCYKIIFDCGKNAFLKIGSYSLIKEANGLLELKKANVIKIPEVYFVAEDLLLLEWIESQKPHKTFWENFGKQFAQLHRFNSSSIGFYEDNYIGKTPQKNVVKDPNIHNWLDFYREYRLAYQIRLCKKNGYGNEKLFSVFERFRHNLGSFFYDSENQVSLLHGDLWSGNYMVGQRGEPVLVDPAVYYGNREADLAMTTLFGGFPDAFYTAYHREYPLPEGYQKRIKIYQLYHVLNHLNLFGHSYLNQAISIMENYC